MAALGIPQNTIAVLQKYHFNFQKKFGQNFLIDPRVLERIMEAAEITGEDFVLEIGPGIGTMTQYLCERAKEVVAVEIDRNLIPILADTLQDYKNVTVLNEDILKLDITRLVREKNGGKPIKVVANLPYYITTPLVMRFLEEGFHIERITVMVQKEVAQRFQAKAGSKDYGAITAMLNYYGEVKTAFMVPKTLFIPQPKVDSAVIDIVPFEQKPCLADDEKLLRTLIKAAFSQRRKTLSNAIKTANIAPEIMHSAFNQCGIDPKRRGETLTIAEFVCLSNCVAQLLNHH